MKRWCAGAVFLIVVLAGLVWFMPARWALPWLRLRRYGVQVEQIDGSIWNGRAEKVTLANGTLLGQLAWMLSRRALIGDIQMELDVRQPQLWLHGRVQRTSATQQDWRDVTVHMDTALLGMQPWLHGAPRGQLDLHVSHMQWQNNWPMQGEAHGTWSSASVMTSHGSAAIGTLLIKLDEQSGVLQGTLDDDGHGPLRTAGRLSFSPLGWDVQLSLHPRNADPVLLGWLRNFGAPNADDTWQLRYRGGLAQLNTTDHR